MCITSRYVHVYTYIHTYTHTYTISHDTLIYIYTYIHTHYIHIYIYKYIYIYTHMYIHIYTHMISHYIHVYTCIHTHVYYITLYTHIHIFTLTYVLFRIIHTYIHIYTRMYIISHDIHTCTHIRWSDIYMYTHTCIFYHIIYDSVSRNRHTPEIHHIENLRFLGTNSNWTKSEIWICEIARNRSLSIRRISGGNYGSFHRNLHLRIPPNRESQIPRCLAVQIQIENLVWSEFVPTNLSFMIRWMLGGVAFSVGSVIRVSSCVCTHIERERHLQRPFTHWHA